MPNKILLKRSSTASAVPTAGSGATQVDVGELAINTADGRLFTNIGGSVVNLGISSIAGQTINPANNTVGTSGGTRVAITGGGGADAVSEYFSTEANPRWVIGRDFLGANSAGIGFGIGSSTLAAGGAAVGYAASRQLGFYTSNATMLAERMRINGSGDVSIGLSTADARLTVRGSGSTSATNAVNITNNSATALFSVRNDGLSTFHTLTTTRIGTPSNAQFYLNGPTSNWIQFNTSGVAAPNVNTRSPGTKICLYPIMNGYQGDYAIGIDNGTFWQSIPSDSDTFKWYAGESAVGVLDGSGNFDFNGVGAMGSTLLMRGFADMDFTDWAGLTFYNSFDPGGEGAVGELAKIIVKTGSSFDSGRMELTLRYGTSWSVPIACDEFGRVIIDGPGSEGALASLDVRGDARISTDATIVGNATVQGSLTVQGGLQSPGEMLYLWSNFR